jgi:hypothetical protein
VTRVSKRIALLLITMLAVSSLIMAESAYAQSIPEPSVPEFTVKIVAYPYDVPTTHSIDPFTGQDVTHEGYHVNNQSIEVRIKNQPFTPYEIQDSNGNRWAVNLFYNIRIRGHFSGDWIELYRPSDGYPHQLSDSDYTVLSYVLGEGDADTVLGTKMIKLPPRSQIDFQVEAMVGYIHRENVTAVPGSGWVFTGESSGWSSTQTITIPANATTTPTDDGTPSDGGNQQTEPRSLVLDIAVVGIIAAAVACTGLLLYFKKRKR